jgi:hypothetical protein
LELLEKRILAFEATNELDATHQLDCDRANRIADQTRDGVNGVSSARTPSRASPSMTALAIAGTAPVVPASPVPLTPSGLLGDGTGR